MTHEEKLAQARAYMAERRIGWRVAGWRYIPVLNKAAEQPAAPAVKHEKVRRIR